MKPKKHIIAAAGFGLLLFGIQAPAMAQANITQKEFGKEYIDAIAVSTRYVSKRPAEADRLFRSEVLEKYIRDVKKKLKDTPYLAWMFENCYPNRSEERRVGKECR